jgi:phosphate transport system permease protein
VIPTDPPVGLAALEANLTRARTTVRRFRDFLDDTEDAALAVVGLAAVALFVAFVGFLMVASWAIIPFVICLAATGAGWWRYQALTARALSLTTTIATIVILVLIVVFIFISAWPVVAYETGTLFGASIPGLDMLTVAEWTPVSRPRTYGLLAMVHGTVMVTLIATLVAGPLGVATALFIAEMAPPMVRETVKPLVEILAGIPSIVYGFLGFTILNPWAGEQFQLNGGPTYLLVGMVVGLMALPTVVSVAEDALTSVPGSMKDGSLALGTTKWQSMTTITLPGAFSGVSAAVLLGVGRAIGETMAATVMLRNSPQLSEPLYNVFYGYETLTSVIATRYGTAHGLHMDALFAAGIVLFVTVMALSVGSQYVEWRMSKTFGGME